jgi:dethiobiotin synthetase
MKSASRSRNARIIFITGTDTGAGKTLLTALLLQHLRESGIHALAMKPFCSGGMADVRLLSAIQEHELNERELNPFYFPEPIAPLVSARKHGRKIRLKEAVEAIQRVAKRCDCLIVEGSGGLRVPLGEGFDVLKLIETIDCEVFVATRNRLGVINHTRMTMDGLWQIGVKKVKIILMETGKKDASTGTNEKILKEFFGKKSVFSLGYLGKNASRKQVVLDTPKKIKKTLAGIIG